MGRQETKGLGGLEICAGPGDELDAPRRQGSINDAVEPYIAETSVERHPWFDANEGRGAELHDGGKAARPQYTQLGWPERTARFAKLSIGAVKL